MAARELLLTNWILLEECSRSGVSNSLTCTKVYNSSKKNNLDSVVTNNTINKEHCRDCCFVYVFYCGTDVSLKRAATNSWLKEGST
jgi:hypothetical protein